MCGIIGASLPDAINPNVVKALLLMAQERGDHATGIGTKDEVIKSAKSAREFIVDLEVPKTNTIVGHTRFATVGSRYMDDNAHPFVYGKNVVTHNGGISNWKDIEKSSLGVKFTVDSQAAAYLINKYNFKSVPKKMKGSFALAWINGEDLNLYRHTNPIYIGKYNGGIVYGSNERYLEIVGASEIQPLPEHVHNVYRNGKLVSSNEVEGPEAVVYKTTYTAQADRTKPFYEETNSAGVLTRGYTYPVYPTHATHPVYISGTYYRWWYDTIAEDGKLLVLCQLDDYYYETYEIDLNSIRNLKWLEKEHHILFNRLNLSPRKIKLLN
jgi:glucosamine 6-phosphate synthetase-like amidotransferase/phosphosugar isomerase protein